jgi:hypothetical protein
LAKEEKKKKTIKIRLDKRPNEALIASHLTRERDALLELTGVTAATDAAFFEAPFPRRLGCGKEAESSSSIKQEKKRVQKRESESIKDYANVCIFLSLLVTS